MNKQQGDDADRASLLNALGWSTSSRPSLISSAIENAVSSTIDHLYFTADQSQTNINSLNETPEINESTDTS